MISKLTNFTAVNQASLGHIVIYKKGVFMKEEEIELICLRSLRDGYYRRWRQQRKFEMSLPIILPTTASESCGRYTNKGLTSCVLG